MRLLIVLFAVAPMLFGCGRTAESPAAAPAKATRAVRLEFKEKKERLTEEEQRADAEFNAAQFTAAQNARTRVDSDPKLTEFIKAAAASSTTGRGGLVERKFADEVPPDLRDVLFDNLAPGGVSEAREVRVELAEGAPVLVGYSVVALLDRDTVPRDLNSPATATVSHLLVSYKGAAAADASVSRTKEEARRLAVALYDRAVKGEQFETLVMTYSDDYSKAENRGRFTEQVVGETDPARNAFVKEFNDAVVRTPEGKLTLPVETAFGYHLIYVERKKPARHGVERQPRVSYAEQFYPTRVAGEWRDTGLTGENVVAAKARPGADQGKYEVLLTFDAQGSRLFRDITARNVGKPVAIFLDGHIYSEPVVQSAIGAGEAIITGAFNAEEAAGLARNIMLRL